MLQPLEIGGQILYTALQLGIVARQYTWVQLDTIRKYYLEPYNFSLLPTVDRFCTEKYFLSSLRHATNIYKGVLYIAFRLLSKSSHTLILCIEVFEKELPHNKPWEIMLEGKQSLAFDLQKGPSKLQVMVFFA